jgi:hypothetical protein
VSGVRFTSPAVKPASSDSAWDRAAKSRKSGYAPGSRVVPLSRSVSQTTTRRSLAGIGIGRTTTASTTL